MADSTQDLALERGDPNSLQKQKRLLSVFLSKKVDPVPLESERVVYPQKTKNPINYVFFWWLTGLLKTGYKRTVQPADLYLLDDKMKIDYMYERFSTMFDKDVAALKEKHLMEKCKARGETIETSSVSEYEDLLDFQIHVNVLIKNLYKTFWFQYTLGIVIKMASDCAQTFSPLLQKALINFVEKRAENYDVYIPQGIGYAIGCSFFVLFVGVTINHFFYHGMITGAEVKAVLTKALLEKSFKVDGRGKHNFPVGKINSIMGTDLSRVDFAIAFQPFVILFPIPMGITIGLLIHNLGVSALLGIGLFFISSAIFGYAAKVMLDIRVKANVFTDRRVNYIKELLKNFKIIKYYSWEKSYQENMTAARKSEMKHIFAMQALRNIVISLATVLPILASMSTFLLLHRLDTNRNVGDIFSSVNLFQNLAFQFLLVPMALATGTDAYIGLKRVSAFLSCGEAHEVKDTTPEDILELEKEDLSLKVVNASFEWKVYGEDDTTEEHEDEDEDKAKETDEEVVKTETKSSEPSEPYKTESDTSGDEEKDTNSTLVAKTSFNGLRNLNFEFKKGEFVVVTGMIGSGKSSLLSALAGFMDKTEGRVLVNGSLLLCGYPWVQNATVKENITFGLPYDEDKYNTIVNACSLKSDFDILPAGDKTEVGERGITLSGGQKARINLARAVYANKDIILMDDVLSAVDARVGKHIMEECILGYLSEKTRVLATHQLSLIGEADKVIFLNGDGSVDMGSMEELQARNEDFVKLMTFSHQSEKDDEAEQMDSDEEDVENDVQDFNAGETGLEADAALIKKQISRTITSDGKLMKEEERAVNSISWNVYKRYLQAGSGVFGNAFSPIMIVIFVVATFCQLFTNTWLSFWTSNKFPGRSGTFYSGIYVMFTILTIIFLVTEFSLMVYFCNNAAKNLNIKAAERLVHAPMSFMDTTPMGRVLNRFTKDTDVLDNEIVEQIRQFFYPFCTIMGTIILCIIYLPWFAIAVPFLAFLYVSIAGFYQASAREIKRLEAVKRSKVYAHFNESLGGMDTIKAYKDADRFIHRNDVLIDEQNEAYYVTIANQRWLAINLDMVATVFALIISLLCITRQFKISGSSTGLLLTYVLTIAGALSQMLRAMTQIENELNSAERLIYYGYNLVQEAPFDIPERDPEPNWPSEGKIVFDNVSLRYRPELPYVLKNMSITVNKEEKIGICGRTGAGKSTIMTAIYRLSEISEGTVFIDGVDISTLGLNRLRSKLSIIPQDPVLFSGSIRNNLDPFNNSSDEKLWDALRRADLIEADVLERVKLQKKGDENFHKFHLDQFVEDDGSNFSLGERQLIALARALVRDSKILILDEATSSVDYETDSKIQKTIVEEFGNCTILCIAHRLKTIVNYDKILVLDKGEVVEYDTPWNLYTNTKTVFRSMCDKSGVTADDFKHK